MKDKLAQRGTGAGKLSGALRFCVKFLVLAVALSGQDATFKSSTRLIIVDLTATDKSGRPVTTLKKEDVQVFEDGVKQEIAIFELQKLDSEPLTPMSFATRTTETAEEKAPAPKAVVAPAANQAIRYQDKRLICLFFDMTSMQPPEQVRAQDSAVKFLQSQMTSSDLVEIM